MKLLCLFALTLSFGLCTAQTYQLNNGRWFNGTSFSNETWYSQDGLLTKTKPNKIDSIIDFAGHFVVPPYAEAHNHNVRYFSKFRELSDGYLKTGIYYVKNPNSRTQDKQKLTAEGLINNDHSIDAVFANGGLTSPGGHPTSFFGGTSEGDFYYTMTSVADLDSKWPAIASANPDFIKTYLLFSDEYEKRIASREYQYARGLDPELLKEVVSRAHAAGLTVTCHVETGADFSAAVAAGVNEIAHMPGFRGEVGHGLRATKGFSERFSISEESARIAAKNGVVVVTTLGDFKKIPFFFPLRRVGDRLHKKNLATLKSADVNIILGSDSFEKDSFWDLDYLKKTEVFSALELVKMMCEATPKAIFPNRKIGAFAEGYEASFLILEKDPTDNLKNLHSIVHRMKNGKFLALTR
jgi:predicted amidohydrolase YtcJ